MRMRMRIVVGAVVACVGWAACLASAAGAAASNWSIQPTPNPVGATASALSGVACVSLTTCVAVGYFTDGDAVREPLAERWTGTHWSIQRAPSPAGATSSLLFAVSCTSTRACIAVGSVTKGSGVTVPLAERWNGFSWAIQQTPDPVGARGAVSYLGGVSCASRTACTAVGFSGSGTGTTGVALAERWDGSSWEIERTPHPTGAKVAFLSSVSCVSPMSCTAVGFLNNAAGVGLTLAERWNGTAWAILPTPTPEGAAYVQLVGASCGSPVWCTAVGFFTDLPGINVMLAERWNGSVWVIQRTLYPAGARYVQFSAVSCASAVWCTAVGIFNNVPGIDVTLAEHWNGSTWAIQRTPNPPGATSSSLGAVSCPSTTRCMGVGDYTNGAGTDATLAELYGGI